MSKLQELIKHLCPDGIPFKPLGEFCNFKRGQTITERIAIAGDVPVIAGGQKPAYYHNVSNRKGETIAIAGSGAYAGFVSWWTIPVYISDAFTVHPNDTLLPKFVYYYLINIQQKIHNTKKGSGVPHVHGSSIAKFLIPVPPIEVQEEIVKILDCFSDYAAELQAELQARKEQYEYYRNLLLTFNPSASGSGTDDKQEIGITTLSPGSYKIKWKTMGEIAKCFAGATPKTGIPEYWNNGFIPWMSSGEVNKHVIYETEHHITQEGFDSCSTKMIPANSIVMAMAGQGKTRGLVALTKIALCTNQSLCGIIPNHAVIKSNFLYHYLVSRYMDLRTISSGDGTRGGLNLKIINNYKIPVPPLELQEKIVSILDRFETLVNDLSKGLPAEIAAVKEQYEYYRNHLLTFKKLA